MSNVCVQYGDLCDNISNEQTVEAEFGQVVQDVSAWVSADGGTRNRSAHVTEYTADGRTSRYRRLLPVRN